MAVAVVAQSIAPRLRRDYGTYALANLRSIRDDVTFPDEIRAAAARLLGGPRDLAAGGRFSNNPIRDAELIIAALRSLLPDTDDC